MANNTCSNWIITTVKRSGTSFILSTVKLECSLLINTVLFVSFSTTTNFIKKLWLKSKRSISPELFQICDAIKYNQIAQRTTYLKPRGLHKLKTLRQPSQKSLAKSSSTRFFLINSMHTSKNYAVKIFSKLHV